MGGSLSEKVKATSTGQSRRLEQKLNLSHVGHLVRRGGCREARLLSQGPTRKRRISRPDEAKVPCSGPCTMPP